MRRADWEKRGGLFSLLESHPTNVRKSAQTRRLLARAAGSPNHLASGDHAALPCGRSGISAVTRAPPPRPTKRVDHFRGTGQVSAANMSNWKTRIDPDLHFVQCGDCDWMLEFERMEALSNGIHSLGPIYTDYDLQKGSCPTCGSRSLILSLKGNRGAEFQHRNQTSRVPSQHGPKQERGPIHPGPSPEPTKAADGILGKFHNQVLDIEKRIDLSDDEKVNRIRHAACLACAATAIQPIPFADIFILTPIQGFFATRIAAIRGVNVSENDGQEWTKQIIGLMGLGFIAQQLAIGVWKLVTWGVGGLLTLPLVYSLTYAVMTTADVYFKHRAKGVQLTDDQLREEFRKATRAGKVEAEKHKTSIKDMAEPPKSD